MVVGEPTLMGGEFGDEDERLITRLENQQFEPGSAEGENPPQGGDSNTPASSNQQQFQNSPGGDWPVDKKPPQPVSTPGVDTKSE